MIFALLYCMENKTQFILTDAGANFASWSQIPYEEYFTPFCKINRDKIHKRFNVRDRGVASSFRKKHKLKVWFYKTAKGVRFFTQDIFDKVYPAYYDKDINIPELNIKGMTYDVIKPFAKMVWNFNSKTRIRLDNVIKNMNLPEKYAAIQTRRGDKSTIYNCASPEPEKYMEILKQKSDIKDVLLLSDDYCDVEKFISNYPQYNFYTFCKPSEHGYSNQSFQAMEREKKDERLIELLATVDAMTRAEIFIGTEIANPQLLLKMIMDSDKFYLVEKFFREN